MSHLVLEGGFDTIPRNGLAWLLVAMFAAILPHMLHLPLWLSAVCLLCGGWRVMVYRGRWSGPSALVRGLLVFGGGAAVFGHYGSLVGPDAGTALLILGFCFKLVESRTARDAFIVVILGYFVVAASFFFDQSILMSLYLGLVCVMITAALVGLNQSALHTRPRRTLKHSLKLMAMSLPLVLILFLLVPRIGPIWSLDLGDNRAKTGLSDTIAPGDIANLSRSSALAFRVEFEAGSPQPVPSQRYWRALVLDHYDGRRWSRSIDYDHPDRLMFGNRAAWQPKRLGEAGVRRFNYSVMMEPTDQRWLFAMAWARSDNRDVGSSRDFRLVSRKPVSQPFRYRVESLVGTGLDAGPLPAWMRRAYLQLPDQGDPRARALARQLLAKSDHAEAFIDQLLTHFNQQPFSYTLRPPLLSGDRIDQFLFETRRGFCSHYAGAFVFMMRAAGLPARIVTGYQGGELNPLGNYLLVHQFDAHAWAEVWLAGRGWVRFDPTAHVAPERVEQGVEQALAAEQSFLEGSPLSPLRYRHLGWVSQLRLGWDYLNYSWYQMVLGYDAKAQRELLGRLFGDLFGRIDLRTIGFLMAVSVMLVLTGLSLWMLGRGYLQRPRDPQLKLYRQLCVKLARAGIEARSGESHAALLARAAQAYPAQASQFERIGQRFERLLYAPPKPQSLAVADDKANQRRQLKRLIIRLQL